MQYNTHYHKPNSDEIRPMPSNLLIFKENIDHTSVSCLIRTQLLNNKGNLTDITALAILLGLSRHANQVQTRINNREKYLTSERLKRKKSFQNHNEFTEHGGGIFKITSHNVWALILNFLLHDNAFQCIPPILGTAQFSTVMTKIFNFIPVNNKSDAPIRAALTISCNDSPNRLTSLTNCLKVTYNNSLTTLNTNFFSKNYQAGFEFTVLLDSALNADLKMAEQILKDANPKNRETFLSELGKATITHLDIERIGTPLQMALYSHDDEMVNLFKQHMHPDEFQRQWEAVFGTSYSSFLEAQKTHATLLCRNLESVFKDTSKIETDSAAENELNRFKKELETYTKENTVHNPYILQALFKIYDNLENIELKHRFLSSTPIGLTEKFSSAMWLSRLAKKILYSESHKTYPSEIFRHFSPQGNPSIDLRTPNQLGINSYIDIYGMICEFNKVHLQHNNDKIEHFCTNYLIQKEKTWQQLTPKNEQTATQNSAI